MATQPQHINVAMFLIGIGCSPVLMASYFIFAREYPPARFATLAALMLGMGSVGNLVASYPMALAVDWIGWRGAIWGLSGASAAVGVGILATVRDPARHDAGGGGSLLTLLKLPVMWTILPMMFVCYAPSGAVRGLWIGPYLRDVFGQDTGQIGTATLIMGCAMIAGTLAFGPLDRIFHTRKWVIFAGNLSGALAMLALVALIDHSVTVSIIIIAVAGFMGGTFAPMIAHGRAFVPPHLVGRGVTLMNLFGIGGVGLMQFASGRMHEQFSDPASVTAPYSAIFAFFGLSLLVGTLIYLFSKDSLD